MRTLKFTIVILSLCLNSSVLYAQGLTQQQKTTIENAIIEEMKASKTPGAAISIINDGQVVYENSFGLANSQTKIDLADTSIFQIASVTKIFTSLTLLNTLKHENISLHDPIGNVIKGLSPVLSSVTYHQLLTHTSGMKDFVPSKDQYYPSVYNFFKNTGDNILFADPGDTFSYSNIINRMSK